MSGTSHPELVRTIAEIRRLNLELLIDELGSSDAVAGAGTTDPVYISQLRHAAPDSKTGKTRQIGDVLARKLEAGCGKERGWMDHEHDPLTYRQQRALEMLRVMERMPDWKFDQAVKIIDTIAQPAPMQGNGDGGA